MFITHLDVGQQYLKLWRIPVVPVDHVSEDLVLIRRLIRRILHFMKLLKGARHLQSDSSHTIQRVICVHFFRELVKGKETGGKSDENSFKYRFNFFQNHYLNP